MGETAWRVEGRWEWSTRRVGEPGGGGGGREMDSAEPGSNGRLLYYSRCGIKACRQAGGTPMVCPPPPSNALPPQAQGLEEGIGETTRGYPIGNVSPGCIAMDIFGQDFMDNTICMASHGLLFSYQFVLLIFSFIIVVIPFM